MAGTAFLEVAQAEPSVKAASRKIELGRRFFSRSPFEKSHWPVFLFFSGPCRPGAEAGIERARKSRFQQDRI